MVTDAIHQVVHLILDQFGESVSSSAMWLRRETGKNKHGIYRSAAVASSNWLLFLSFQNPLP